MKVTTALIQGVVDIFTASKARRDAEYTDFLAFYRAVVENTSADVAKVIGSVAAFAVDGDNKGARTAGLLLTVTSYIEWKHAIAGGLRFQNSTLDQVKTFMVTALAKAAEANKLTGEERKALMTLLDA